MMMPKLGVVAPLFGILASTAISPLQAAQDVFPSDAEMQKALGGAYNHLGLIEYCADHGHASEADVVQARKVTSIIVGNLTVEPAALAQEDAGRDGTIVGLQIVGRMDLTNAAHPEVVPDGRTMLFADNARAQKLTERELCQQMVAQMQSPE
ncbi:hypothetical protein [Novosphingobium terrae]|uniref:hypothetical protein n=1 Tax=Novosphingobium terrae TaxID=2726189 RepID=UPI00197DA65C|nr:hypothetical protein [Novosphingobium terrae]